jgi:hypothetical protein
MRRLHYQWIPFPSHLSHLPLLVPETEVLILSASIPYIVLPAQYEQSPAPTESPKRSPRTHADCEEPSLRPSNVCRGPYRVPDSRCGLLLFSHAMSRSHRWGGVWEGCVALTGVAYLRTRMGGSNLATFDTSLVIKSSINSMITCKQQPRKIGSKIS